MCNGLKDSSEQPHWSPRTVSRVSAVLQRGPESKVDVGPSSAPIHCVWARTSQAFRADSAKSNSTLSPVDRDENSMEK